MAVSVDQIVEFASALERTDFVGSGSRRRLRVGSNVYAVFSEDDARMGFAYPKDSRAMLTWAHQRGVTLRHIEPGKPNQIAYVESVNGRFREECLNEHWFTSLAHARMAIEEWRRDYNEDRPKKDLGGVPPAVYAARLNSLANSGAKESSTVCSAGL